MPKMFENLESGTFPETAVHVTWTNEIAASNPESQAIFATAWQEAETAAAAHGRLLYDGALCRLVDWQQTDGQISLCFGPTSYQAFVGSHLRGRDFVTRFGETFMANATGVCVALVTADDELVLQRRSERVFENPGFYHVCGGQLEPIGLSGSRGADPFACVRRELLEEFDIPRAEISSLVCLGLARDLRTLKPEVLFTARTSRTTAEVCAVNHEEFSDLYVVPAVATALSDFLTSNAARIVPVGLACLIRFGAVEFGEEWGEVVAAGFS
jgi:8-oxo-dGTP pyrophosphatase MutT (NUDIX family)